MRVFAELFACIVLLCSASLAQSTPAAAAAPAPNFASEPGVIEEMTTIYRYAGDDTGTKEVYVRVRVQSNETAQQFGVLNVPFASATEHVTFESVKVHKPDQSVVETPATDMQEQPEQVTLQAPFYSDLKEAQLPIRGLANGDMLEYRFKVVRSKSEVPGQFWGQESFAQGVVVLHQTYELHVPKDKAVNVWSPKFQPETSETATERVYRWSNAQLKPTVLTLEQKNAASQAAAGKEFNPDGELPDIAWTTFKSWQELGDWYRSLEVGRNTPDAEVQAKVAELTAGKSTDEEKVRALYAFVALHIRYIGVSFGVGRYQPHYAGEVLKNEYGDCKDKHTLLAAMLTAAGFKPEASLIGVGIRLNTAVPSPAAFNHMITALPLGGSTLWMDATEEVAPFRMMGLALRDKQTLVVPDNGMPVLMRTPASMPFTPIESVTAIGTLDTGGTAKAHFEFTSRGDGELTWRAVFRSVNRGQWNELAQGISQRLGYSGSVTNANADRPDQTDTPFHFSYDYTRLKLGDWDHLRIVPLFPLVFVPIPDDNDPPTVPIDLGTPMHLSYLTQLTLPDGWGSEPPPAMHQDSPYASYDETYQQSGAVLIVKRDIVIKQRFVPVGNWKAYKKWTDAVFRNGEPYIQLVSSTAAPAANQDNSSDTDEQKLVTQIHDQMARGEVNAARESVTKLTTAKGVTGMQWAEVAGASINGHQFDIAIDAAKRALATDTGNPRYKFLLVLALYDAGNTSEAMSNARELARQPHLPDVLLRDLMDILGRLSMLPELVGIEAQLLQVTPDNHELQASLGCHQLMTGDISGGRTNLLAALKADKLPGVQNEAGYCLADSNVDLDAAHTAIASAIQQLTAQTSYWSANAALDKTQEAAQYLLIASWDSLAWVLYQQGQATEAEPYAQAAWLSQRGYTTGLHYGLILERAGKRKEALTVYTLSFQGSPTSGPGPGNISNPDLSALQEHKRTLQDAGVKPAAGVTTQSLRTLQLGPHPGSNLTISYRLLLNKGRIVDAVPEEPGSHPEAANAQGKALLLKADMSAWVPADSNANLVMKGMLNCHSGRCELVMY